MIDTILGALGALHIDTWLLRQTQTHSAELFFIRKKEDMRRAKDVCGITVEVYQDFEMGGARMRGSASAYLFPGMSADEITAKLETAKQAARYVKNPWFELCDPVVDEKPYDGNSSMSAQEAADVMSSALFAPDTAQDAFVNSAEIFSEQVKTRILSSRGTDVRFETRCVKGELIAQCLSPVDVEMYFDFEYASPDADALTALVKDALTTVRDRARATHAPAGGTYDVVLSGRDIYPLLSMYLQKADASMIYAKYSSYRVGASVQGETVTGERLNVAVLPDRPYSADGIPMPERTLIAQGKLASVIGSTRFCRYLGIEPVGSYEHMRVDNGTLPLCDLKRAPCLFVAAFSDLQVDEMTGCFGSEIRLAYLIDEHGVTPVTGGSVNGSLLDAQGRLAFSLERYRDSRYDGPLAMRVPGISVAG